MSAFRVGQKIKTERIQIKMKHGTDTRRAALALACVLMASALFSCQSNVSNGENTGGADATSTPVSDPDASESTEIADGLPVKDYGRKEFISR